MDQDATLQRRLAARAGEMPVSRPRLLSRRTREWLEAFAAALCLAIVALIGHAGPEALP